MCTAMWRILTGYDVHPERVQRLVEVFEASAAKLSDGLRAELAGLSGAVAIFSDIETLFSRAQTRLAEDELGPSNDARMAMYLRRIAVRGAGIDPGFLELVSRAL